MIHKPLYEPADMSLWAGREDSEEVIPSLRWHQKMTALGEWTERQIDEKGSHHPIALLGFCCDEGVRRNKGRPGAQKGPDAIRKALANQAYIGDREVIDAGNVICPGHDLEAAQTRLAQHITQLLAINCFLVVLGGGHEVAWGSYQGIEGYLYSSRFKMRDRSFLQPWNHGDCAAPNPTSSFERGLLEKERDDKKMTHKVGIINFDAHLDLRTPSTQGSSGTPFRQIAEHRYSQNENFHYCVIGVNPTANTAGLTKFAEDNKVVCIEDTDCTDENSPSITRKLIAFLSSIDSLYLTICLDVFPASYAPGVSAPSALGVAPQVVIQLLRVIKEQAKKGHVKIIMADIAEMNPLLDKDGMTAKLAARMVHELTQ